MSGKLDLNTKIQNIGGPSNAAKFFAEHKISKLSEDELYTLLARLLKIQVSYNAIQPFIDQVYGELTFRRDVRAAAHSNSIARVALYIALIGAVAAGIQAGIAWLEYSKKSEMNPLCQILSY
jgi:hypothetical protein